MGDELLEQLFQQRESAKVIRSSMKAFCPNPKFVNSNDDNSLSDDDSTYGEDIDYVDVSPPDAEDRQLRGGGDCCPEKLERIGG
ncbi:hypothetical protein Tco_1129950 [Tanacetum coccineum]